MLKFSRYTRDRSATLSESCPDSNRKFKRQKTIENQSANTETDHEEISNENEDITKLKKTHQEFEKFLDMVSNDLKDKIEKQKILKETDKNYAGVQVFMLTKYSIRIERFRQVSRNNLENLINLSTEKENTDQNSLMEYINNHIYIIGKMKRRSKQILDISDKYAVEDIFDNINLVNECSASLQPGSGSTSEPGKMNKWRSTGVLSARKETPVEEVENEVSLRETSKSSRSSTTSTSSRHSKMSTFLSLTDHLAVLTKTYTGRR